MILRNLLYILQSENYDLRRFLKFAYTHPRWWQLENRGKIAWTMKARLLFVLTALVLMAFLVVGLAEWGWVALWMLPIVIVGSPLVIGLLLIALIPLDTVLKQRKISAARRVLDSGDSTVIGITGSYGKTSTKEILSTILKKKFSVVKTPGNVNTDVGIAEFILQNAEALHSSEIFIVEMGAYHKGEIASTCALVRPKYSLLTGINEAHLERFGSLKNTIDAKFELPQHTQELSLLNFDDDNVRENAHKSSCCRTMGIERSMAKNIMPIEHFKGLSFDWQNTTLETVLLAEHNVTLILLGATLAKELGVSVEEIREAVKEIRPVEHRLQPIYNAVTDIMVIDDSYNGNIDGVKSGLRVLDRAKGRKVVLTPGLVELGEKARDIHNRIGEWYAKSVDMVLLIQSPMTEYLLEGMKRAGFSGYTIYKTTQEAHNDLVNILRKGILFCFKMT